MHERARWKSPRNGTHLSRLNRCCRDPPYTLAARAAECIHPAHGSVTLVSLHLRQCRTARLLPPPRQPGPSCRMLQGPNHKILGTPAPSGHPHRPIRRFSFLRCPSSVQAPCVACSHLKADVFVPETQTVDLRIVPQDDRGRARDRLFLFPPTLTSGTNR